MNITNTQLNMYMANSGYKTEVPYRGGTLRLHRVGVFSQVEYFTSDGKFSHIVKGFIDEAEAEAWMEAEKK